MCSCRHRLINSTTIERDTNPYRIYSRPASSSSPAPPPFAITDAQISNEGLYSQRRQGGVGLQNNKTTPTLTLIIRDGDALNRSKRQVTTERHEDESNVNPPLAVNSFNGASRLDSNYNEEHTLIEEAVGGRRGDVGLMQSDGQVMNDDGSKQTTTTTGDTLAFLTADQRSQEPIFDPSTPKNVTALVGKSAYLNCRVRNLANKTVCTTTRTLVQTQTESCVCAILLLGLVDTAPGHTYSDGGLVHLHLGSAVSGDARQGDGRLDVADQMGAEERQRRLRVPSVHAAREELLCGARCCG